MDEYGAKNTPQGQPTGNANSITFVACLCLQPKSSVIEKRVEKQKHKYTETVYPRFLNYFDLIY